MSSELLVLVAVGGGGILLVAAIVAILVIGRRRSQGAQPEAKQLVAGSKERQSVLRLRSQAARLPAVPTIRQMVERAELYDQVEAADLARDVSIDDVARMKLLTMLICGVAGIVVGGLLLQSIPFGIVAFFGGMVLGYLGPDSGIKRAAELRQARISAALPLAMEVVGLTAERTSIDSSLMHYCEYFGQETLAEELGYVMDRVERFRERMDVAMGEMLRKNHNDDLSFLVAAVGQASQLGGRDLRGMLEKRSFELRIKRDQEIKSRALKAPVMMTFPTMLNVLALMIALGGLAALQLGSGGHG